MSVCVETPKTGFLASRLNLKNVNVFEVEYSLQKQAHAVYKEF